LYTSLVDCHLISGCEITPDADNSVEILEEVQLRCLRRLLGLSSRSVTIPLFTETGIMPIRPRRVILTIRYLIYLLKLSPDHFSHLALQEQIRL
ncbi:hypothetical protein BT96DRAFT_778362, partial [Gymnopus androsaceus JB14]